MHTRHLQCERCWSEWQSPEAFAAHIQADVKCAVIPEPPDTRITRDKLRSMNLSRMPFTEASTADGKWKLLYNSLFREDDAIPSNCEPFMRTKSIKANVAKFTNSASKMNFSLGHRHLRQKRRAPKLCLSVALTPTRKGYLTMNSFNACQTKMALSNLKSVKVALAHPSTRLRSVKMPIYSAPP